jgi:hypothetical protein
MAHGSTLHDLTAPRSRFYQGPFGRIFDELEPWRPVDAAGQPIAEADLQAWCLNVANTLMIESVERARCRRLVPALRLRVCNYAAFVREGMRLAEFADDGPFGGGLEMSR